MPRDTADRLAIRDLIENWVLWRDARMWDRFRTVWHKDGQMWATWFQGSYEDFIRVSQEGYDRGVRIMHMLGGMSIDIKGKRAIAQTKMTISQRAKVEGVLCDVVCSGRFYDFLESIPAHVLVPLLPAAGAQSDLILSVIPYSVETNRLIFAIADYDLGFHNRIG